MLLIVACHPRISQKMTPTVSSPRSYLSTVSLSVVSLTQGQARSENINRKFQKSIIYKF